MHLLLLCSWHQQSIPMYLEVSGFISGRRRQTTRKAKGNQGNHYTEASQDTSTELRPGAFEHVPLSAVGAE